MNHDSQAPEHVMVFHIGRSGSRVLGDLLQQHPVLHWDHEAYVSQLKTARRQGAERPDGDPIELLQARLDQAPGSLVFGAEVKFFHLQLFDYSLEKFVSQVVELGFCRFVLLG